MQVDDRFSRSNAPAIPCCVLFTPPLLLLSTELLYLEPGVGPKAARRSTPLSLCQSVTEECIETPPLFYRPFLFQLALVQPLFF